MDNLPPSQRICTSCGLSKPLSAFLYISSTRGTTYGSICSSCRSIQIARKEQLQQGDDDTGPSKPELRIGAKEKRFQEKEWARKVEEKKQQDLEQKKIDEKLTEEKLDKSHQKIEEKKRKDTLTQPSEKKPRLPQQATAKQKPSKHAKYIPGGITAAEAGEPEALLMEKTQKDIKEQRLGGTLVNVAPQQTLVSRTSATHLSFLRFLGGASPEGRALAAKTKRAQQLFTPQGEAKATTNTPHPRSNDPEKKPGFKSRK